MRKLHNLRRKIEAAPKGSAKLEEAVAAVFPSAPPNVTRSIDAVIQLIETELPGWWWTCGYCKLTNDASLYPPGSHRFRLEQLSQAMMGPDLVPEGFRLCNHPTLGKRFDAGFHRDRRGGTVPLSLLSAFLAAKIAIAEAKLSTDPLQIAKEQRAAMKAHKQGIKEAREQIKEVKKLIGKLGIDPDVNPFRKDNTSSMGNFRQQSAPHQKRRGKQMEHQPTQQDFEATGAALRKANLSALDVAVIAQGIADFLAGYYHAKSPIPFETLRAALEDQLRVRPLRRIQLSG